MCLIFWIIATFGTIVPASIPALAVLPAQPAAADPLLPYLQDDDPRARVQVLGVIRDRALAPCLALRAYARIGNSRVRGNAVQAMDDAGCSDFEAYSDYLLDGSAFVVAAIVVAAERHVMKDAVPFLLGSLTDRRRIVSEQGTGSIGEAALRALMVITCQSFHFDPNASRDDQRNAVTRWRQWYLAKRNLSRDEWVQEGIGRARDYAGRDFGPHRVEGLRLLALIGPPALPTLRELLARKPGDLQSDVVCLPDEPPRVTDAVPCALVLRNDSKRPLAIAPQPDGPEVRMSRSDAPADARPTDGPSPSGGTAAEALSAFADHVLDLAPGEVVRFEFTAGPVLAAGRYRVRAALVDLAAGLVASAIPLDKAPRKRDDTGRGTVVPSSTIEAETIVRFEQ